MKDFNEEDIVEFDIDKLIVKDIEIRLSIGKFRFSQISHSDALYIYKLAEKKLSVKEFIIKVLFHQMEPKPKFKDFNSLNDSELVDIIKKYIENEPYLLKHYENRGNIFEDFEKSLMEYSKPHIDEKLLKIKKRIISLDSARNSSLATVIGATKGSNAIGLSTAIGAAKISSLASTIGAARNSSLATVIGATKGSNAIGLSTAIGAAKISSLASTIGAARNSSLATVIGATKGSNAIGLSAAIGAAKISSLASTIGAARNSSLATVIGATKGSNAIGLSAAIGAAKISSLASTIGATRNSSLATVIGATKGSNAIGLSAAIGAAKISSLASTIGVTSSLNDALSNYNNYFNIYNHFAKIDYSEIRESYKNKYVNELDEIYKKYYWSLPCECSEIFVDELVNLYNNNGSQENVDNHFIEYFSQNNYKNLIKMIKKWGERNNISFERINIIKNALNLIIMDNGENYPDLIIPPLIAQIDGLINDIVLNSGFMYGEGHRYINGDDKVGKGNINTFKDIISEIKLFNNNSQCNELVLNILFSQVNPGEPFDFPIPFSRHKIMHGLDSGYGIFANCLRCFIIIDFLENLLAHDLKVVDSIH